MEWRVEADSLLNQHELLIPNCGIEVLVQMEALHAGLVLLDHRSEVCEQFDDLPDRQTSAGNDLFTFVVMGHIPGPTCPAWGSR